MAMEDIYHIFIPNNWVWGYGI